MTDTNGFRHNHYVPEWYQKRFMLSGHGTYHYLDLKPDTVEQSGHRYTRRNVLRWPPRKCFAQNDLYTVKDGSWENTDIERFFFGQIDAKGKAALEFFSDFTHSRYPEDAFIDLMTYMSVQKLRTPKGLGWLRMVSRAENRNVNLMNLQALKNWFCAIWTECVWQIADATHSDVKFIVSDHPVTVYNRGCFPGSIYCLGFNEPPITFVGTHTYFPLSFDKVLILTNLSWVRNPYQRETNERPNPKYLRSAMFRATKVQTHRSLSDEEVLQINYITKKRALRYVAAAKREWLYPEMQLLTTNWKKFGAGYLLMPEPREVHMGGQIYIGYEGGRTDAFSEYGHKPWEDGYEDKKREAIESAALERFKAEFSRMQGPAYRGTSNEFGRIGPHVASPEFHRHYLKMDKRNEKVDRRKRR